MPRRERTQNKERFACWLIRQIDSKEYNGVRWLDKSRTEFRLPWKHLNIQKKDEMDYKIFKAWAIQSGKYNAQCEDPPTWKTNFRCALNGVGYKDGKMFTELTDYSSDQNDPHKIYKFNGDHNDLRASSPTAAANTVYLTTPAEQNLWNEIEEDEDYTLRISPDCSGVSPFVHSQESEVVAELMKNILLDSSESGIQQVLQLSQDEYAQDAPFVAQVFRQSINEQCPNSGLEKPCAINGHDHGVHEETAIRIPVLQEQRSQYHGCNGYHNEYLQNASGVERVSQQLSALSQVESALPVLLNGFGAPVQNSQACQMNGFYPQSSQDAMYNSLQNGCPQDVAGVDHSPVYSYHTPIQECVRSSQVCHIPPVINGHGLPPTQEAHVNLFHQQRTMPRLTSWEVTVFYRGMEVLKQNVSRKVVITQDIGDHQLQSTDIVRLPTTDLLVDQQQIELTNTILRAVGEGLCLEVSPEDYKLYAKRMGNTRVFWGLSESLETRQTASQAKLLSRDVQTAIFDFNQFWEDLKGYKNHSRISPDYTIYLSFGQTLFEPVMKKLVLVKLVPNFCTFFHQAAQRDGASSLYSELVSLQISHGSSYNSYDFDGMDFDLSICY
ncbi:interferon regulatory factor 7 [Pseudophryne corroboree]|uniref:interferon regulatory factor 7 n=1 Tax=Pseudophryne corroboree TaxID=495146 RepID=UPI003081E600